MAAKTLRSIVISFFVIVWLILFHYESTRYFFLQPMLHRSLPQMKFLFPPAGWIMFYNVGNSYGTVEVYGLKDQQPQLIDPHQILLTRAIGYDNIHRNAMLSVLEPQMREGFCTFLKRKFPYFEGFYVTYAEYSHLTQQPFERHQTILYECH